MTPSDSPGSKIGGMVQTARKYLSRGPSYSQFCPKIRCHGNRGGQGRNLNDTVGKPGPENTGVRANSAQLSLTGTVIPL